MELMHMTAVGKGEKRSHYTLVKEDLAEEPLNEIMEKIGAAPLYYSVEGDSPTKCGMNSIQHIVAGKYDIDVIYTHNRIILIVRAPKEQQKTFKELMLAYSKMDE
jgi:carbamoylphosphate synthase large subunit